MINLPLLITLVLSALIVSNIVGVTAISWWILLFPFWFVPLIVMFVFAILFIFRRRESPEERRQRDNLRHLRQEMHGLRRARS